MNSALTYALYFLVQKELGLDAPMPTNQVYWNGVDDCSDAALIADLTIWATTTPKAANQAFNSVNGDYVQWRYMWPRIAEYLGAYASTDMDCCGWIRDLELRKERLEPGVGHVFCAC